MSIVRLAHATNLMTLGTLEYTNKQFWPHLTCSRHCPFNRQQLSDAIRFKFANFGKSCRMERSLSPT